MSQNADLCRMCISQPDNYPENNVFDPYPYPHPDLDGPDPPLNLKAGRGQSAYRCPVYTIPARTGLNYIFAADVASAATDYKWVLRGVALVCSKD